jgi:hypothetical protein
MSDHLQGIFSFPRKPGLTTSMILWKKHLAEGLGISWQPGFFDHRLREPMQVLEKTDHILHHPVRSGLCRTWQDWLHVFRPPLFQTTVGAEQATRPEPDDS